MFHYRSSVIFLILSFSCLFAIRCAEPEYKNYDDFLKSTEEKRHGTIKRVLESNGISISNKFRIRFVEYILTNIDSYKRLEIIIPTPDFNSFLSEAIPIIYYTYDLDEYKLCPDKFKDKTTKFLVNSVIYDFSYGEDKFRKCLHKKLKAGNPMFFPYTLSENDLPENKWNEDTRFIQSWILNDLIWDSPEFGLSDVKKLPIQEQAKLFKLVSAVKLAANNKIDDEMRQVVNVLESWWKSNGASIWNTKEFKNLPEDITLSQLIYKVTMAFLASKR